MRVLYVTTIGLTMIFFKDFIKDLIDDGHTVDIACNETISKVDESYYKMGCRIYPIDCSRSPFNAGNFKAIKQLKRIITDGQYDIVHCHTPIAGACTRLACMNLRKNGVKVFYTAHGFHFYKGAPMKNWLIFYPIEKFCSRFTDILITINSEDYDLAKKKMKAKHIKYVPGVGVNIDKFKNAVVDKMAKRHELEIPEDAFLLISVGELNDNKNHQIVIRALAQLHNPDVHYLIVGEGSLHDHLIRLSEDLGVNQQVHFAGFRTDVAQLYKIADVNVFPSIREGFGLAAIEGMAAGLPLVCSDNRGTREFAEDGENAIICNTVDDYKSAFSKLYLNYQNVMTRLKENGSMKVQQFSIDTINQLMEKVYFG